MEKLLLQTVLSAERQAVALGSASVAALKESAEKWRLENEFKQLEFEDGVAEVIDRITKLPL